MPDRDDRHRRAGNRARLPGSPPRRRAGDFERAFFSAQLERLLVEAPGGRVLDLGCADGLVRELCGARVDEYVGIDLHPPAAETEGQFFAHDLGEGLGPVGGESFDLYFASFGVASHLAPHQLERLCRDIAAHAHPGSRRARGPRPLLARVAVAVGDAARIETLPYRLAAETRVHPWAPSELEGIFADAGISPVRALDRSVQAGPKVGGGDYWPGLPPVRASLNDLILGTMESVEGLEAPLPPLPAHPAARVHHALVARRQELIGAERGSSPQALARAIWALDPSTGGGFGHGLLAVGRVE